MTCICTVPAVTGLGGMASFRQRFEAGLNTRGIRVTHNPYEVCDAILIIGGTRRLLPLWRARRRGTRIVQRLDGMNWIHRRRGTGIRHFLRAEYGNLILSWIRAHIATHIVYQSEFSRQWWTERYGDNNTAFSVVLNGIDLSEYQPEGAGSPPAGRCRLLLVEGKLGGGYDMGLESALQLAEVLTRRHGLSMEVVIVGQIGERMRKAAESASSVPITWTGPVPRERIPEIDRSAHLFFSADLNPACPNSAIEALACGLPVLAFDTGALRELIVGDSGRLVPYGGDPWRLEKPDVPALAEAGAEILRDRARFSAAARSQAERALGLDRMVEGYLKALLEE